MSNIAPGRLAAALAITTLVAGCLGSGGGGGGGGGWSDMTVDEMEAEIASLGASLGGTSDLPSSGTASYSGSAVANVREAAQGGPIVGWVASDIALDIDFDPANDQPIDGSMSNFRGEIDGEAFTDPDLELVVNRHPNATRITVVEAGDLPEIPGVPTLPDFRSGSLAVTFEGANDAGSANVVISGGFFGAGASHAMGSVAGFLTESGEHFPGGTLDGHFIIEKD